jgi:hypothetical protein
MLAQPLSWITALMRTSNNPSFLRKQEPSDFQALEKLKTLDPSLRSLLSGRKFALHRQH